MVAYIGLFGVISIFGMIWLIGRRTSRLQAEFYAALARAGFHSRGELPTEWQADFGYLNPWKGILSPGFPEIVVLIGHLQGTSVGTTRTLDLYMGYTVPAAWGLTPEQCAKLAQMEKKATTRISAKGDCLFIWKQPHAVSKLNAMLEGARRHLLEIYGEVKTASPAGAPVSPPAVVSVAAALPPPLVSSAPDPVASTPLSVPPAVPDDVFVDDNTWPWRKEGNYGYNSLPEEALKPGMRVISLYFHIFSILTPRVGDLRKLERLTIFNADLSELPEEIGQCKALRELRIQQCHLKALPRSICGLTGLEVLDLTHNYIAELPEEIGRLTSLRKLIVTANPLKRLPDSIGQLAHLEVLSVACGFLEELPASLASIHTLKELVFSYDSKMASELDRWKAVFPAADVRIASVIETAMMG